MHDRIEEKIQYEKKIAVWEKFVNEKKKNLRGERTKKILMILLFENQIFHLENQFFLKKFHFSFVKSQKFSSFLRSQ